MIGAVPRGAQVNEKADRTRDVSRAAPPTGPTLWTTAILTLAAPWASPQDATETTETADTSGVIEETGEFIDDAPGAVGADFGSWDKRT